MRREWNKIVISVSCISEASSYVFQASGCKVFRVSSEAARDAMSSSQNYSVHFYGAFQERVERLASSGGLQGGSSRFQGGPFSGSVDPNSEF